MTGSDAKEAAGALDRALDGSFPASDPPAMTSPSTATPSADHIADGGADEVRIYRVVRADQAAEPFAPDDRGGRWTPPGTPCVYASLSPAAALLEFLVHVEGRTPDGLLLAVGAIPAGALLDTVNEPSTWRERPYRSEVQQVGADWLEAGGSLALRVPSAVCGDDGNVLLNPRHRDHAALQLLALRPLAVDERLRC